MWSLHEALGIHITVAQLPGISEGHCLLVTRSMRWTSRAMRHLKHSGQKLKWKDIAPAFERLRSGLEKLNAASKKRKPKTDNKSTETTNRPTNWTNECQYFGTKCHRSIRKWKYYEACRNNRPKISQTFAKWSKAWKVNCKRRRIFNVRNLGWSRRWHCNFLNVEKQKQLT